MSGVAAAASAVNPIGDASRLHRVVKVVGWIAAAAAVGGLLELAGVDVSGWIAGLWDTLGSVSPRYLLAALAVQTAVTSLNALGWLFVLRAGYPGAHIPYAPVLATYAVGSALNPLLPGNVGSIVVLFMFVAIIPGATFARMSSTAVRASTSSSRTDRSDTTRINRGASTRRPPISAGCTRNRSTTRTTAARSPSSNPRRATGRGPGLHRLSWGRILGTGAGVPRRVVGLRRCFGSPSTSSRRRSAWRGCSSRSGRLRR